MKFPKLPESMWILNLNKYVSDTEEAKQELRQRLSKCLLIEEGKSTSDYLSGYCVGKDELAREILEMLGA